MGGGGGVGGRERREPGAVARKPKVQKVWVAKIFGLYGKNLRGKGSPVPRLESSG